MKILVTGDYHIEETCSSECVAISNEICSYDADIMVNLGDLFEKKSPTPYETYIASLITKAFTNKFSEVCYLTGNHTEISPAYTNIDYLAMISDNLKIVGNEYIFENILFGHYMTNKSSLMYCKSDRSVEPLTKHRFTLLGHQHSFQKLADNVWHLGSTRWVHFGEANDEKKYCAIIENGNIVFHEIKNAVPMRAVSTLDDLRKLSNKTKIYYKIRTFEQLKNEIEELKKVQKDFYMFRIKIEPVTNNNSVIQVNTNRNIRETIKKWIDELSNNDIKTELIDEFVMEGLYDI
jgi:predicted phosphodiesterase